MKKVLASIALAGMLIGGGATGLVHASTPDQSQEVANVNTQFKSKVIVDDNFTTSQASIFTPLLGYGSASIGNETLLLQNGGSAGSKNLELKYGKTYRITLKKVEGDVLLSANWPDGIENVGWWDRDNHGHDITHYFVAKASNVNFGLTGHPDASLRGFILEEIN
ncbi:hypothetical protein ABNF65_21980 [Paenibacillus larvae]